MRTTETVEKASPSSPPLVASHMRAHREQRPLPVIKDQPTFEQVQPYLAEIETKIFMDETEAIMAKMKVEFPALDMHCLEGARRWAWQQFRASRDPKEIYSLYLVIIDNLDTPLSPDLYYSCKDHKAVEKQVKNYKKVLGENYAAWRKGEEIPLAVIDDYSVTLGRHKCEFGSGLICARMWRDGQALFQVSFYPASPFIIFEIKGMHHEDDPVKAKELKRDLSRFESKFNESVPTALVREVIAIADSLDERVVVNSRAARWRNAGIAKDPLRADRADALHRTVASELHLTFPEPTQRMYTAINDVCRHFLGDAGYEATEKFRSTRIDTSRVVDILLESFYRGKSDAEIGEIPLEQFYPFVRKIINSDYFTDRLGTIGYGIKSGLIGGASSFRYKLTPDESKDRDFTFELDPTYRISAEGMKELLPRHGLRAA